MKHLQSKTRFRTKLKYGFSNKVISERWNSDKLNTFTTYLSLLLGVNHAQKWGQIWDYSNMLKKCSTCQSFIFPKWLCYKIHTLVKLLVLNQCINGEREETKTKFSAPNRNFIEGGWIQTNNFKCWCFVLKARSCSFIQSLSWFYPVFIRIKSG